MRTNTHLLKLLKCVSNVDRLRQFDWLVTNSDGSTYLGFSFPQSHSEASRILLAVVSKYR